LSRLKNAAARPPAGGPSKPEKDYTGIHAPIVLKGIFSYLLRAKNRAPPKAVLRPVSFQLCGWAGKGELKNLRPAHQSFYLFSTNDASGGQEPFCKKVPGPPKTF